MRSRHISSALCLLLLVALACVLSPVQAVQQTLAGKIDWHKPYIGIPRDDLQSTVVTLPGGNQGFVTITERNVVAVLNVNDGEIVWRQILEPEDRVIDFQVTETAVLTVSGLETPTLRSFSLATGHVQWESSLRSSSDVPLQLFEPLNLGTKVVSLPGDDLAVLLGGKTVSKIDSRSGETKWTWTSDEAIASTQIDLVPGSTDLTVISMIQSFASPQLSITKLSLESGKVTEQARPVQANLAQPKDYILTGSSRISWIDAQTKQLKSGLVHSLGKAESVGVQGKFEGLRDVGFRSQGKFVARREDGSEHIVTIGNEVGAKAKLEGFTLSVAHDAAKHGKILSSIVRGQFAIITTASGSIQGWKESKLVWTREEALSEPHRSSVVVELPERKVEQTISVLDHEGLVARTIRHLQQLIYLPGYASSLVSRFTSGSYTKSLSSTPLDSSNLFRDQFGFQKLIILATARGQIYAIDSAHGNIVWSTRLPQGDEHIDVIGMWNVRSGLDLGSPVIAIVANELKASKLSAIAYHLDAYTGRAVVATTGQDAAVAKIIGPGPALRAFPVPLEHCKTHIQAIAIVSEDQNVHFFPSCKKIKGGFANISAQTFFHVAEYTRSSYLVRGYAIATKEGPEFSVYPTWVMPLAADEVIVDVADLQQGVIAAYGRVLGDRTTLYKYLNPHLVAYATINERAGHGTIYVIDTTSGAVVHETALPGIDVKVGIQVKLAENWLVYAYAEKEEHGKTSRGQRLVSTELYEGAFPDERSNSLSASTLTGVASVHAVTRTFVVPVGIKALAMTTSMHGITNKDLIVTTDRDQLLAVPRRMLDPRRPDVPSARDKEEFLMPYQPVLFLDPKWTISHTYDVMGIEMVMTTPSLLESTSMIISTGLDLFGSRATPSGTFDILSDHFNKTQLLLTILGLGIGIAVARPAVTRKVLKARWY